jgi:hypothetical protein
MASRLAQYYGPKSSLTPLPKIRTLMLLLPLRAKFFHVFRLTE